MRVFTELIRYFQKHLQTALVKHTGHEETHQARWVITVPSTWNESAREFLMMTALQVLIDFSLTVKAVTLIFISGRGSAISSAKEGKSCFIYNLVKS